ncbi:MAG: hypothetical protein DHS20C15_27800 [Planctomycetota bacterium]|nr:MAG: hypothetical protein DHS20C15_27800 [Planctomycetota bacterium]
MSAESDDNDDSPKPPRDPNRPLGLRREELEDKPAKPAAPAESSEAAAPESSDAGKAAPSEPASMAPGPIELTSSPPVSSFSRTDDNEADGAQDRPADFERPGGLLSKIDGHMVMYHDPSSLQAEQYRACRTRLTAMNRVGAPWALVVTSSRAGEGRSVTSANLAACLAELPGTRVCLLEVDGRKPEQAELFGVRAEPGTVDLLEGRAALKDVLRSTLLPGVDLIPAGCESDNPAELLGEEKFRRLVDDLKRRYTWVLIDAPPVHPYTDACVVTPLTEGALLVVRLGETPREMVTRSIENIEAAGGKVIGSFVTGRVPGAEDEERLGDYAYELDFDAEGSADPRLLRERKDAEKRLRKQEMAHLKRMQKVDRRDDQSSV